MTAIIGMADGTNVWIGGDSAGFNGHYTRFTVRGKKVFRCGDVLIAGSGSHRVLQIIETCFECPAHDAGRADEVYLIASFIPELRRCLKEHDLALLNGEDATTLMLGYRGTLYICGHDFGITCPEPQARCIGAGGDFALGAFQVCRVFGMDVESAMLRALKIAGDNDVTVAAPYYVEKL